MRDLIIGGPDTQAYFAERDREFQERASVQTKHTKAQPAPKQDENAVAVWPLIIAETEARIARAEPGMRTRAERVGALLVADMRARHEFGVAKYGVPLAADNARDHLSDAYQEMLDGIVYLRAEMIRNPDDAFTRSLYVDQYALAMKLRERLYERDGR